MVKPTLRIGLTGGIGSGKSTAAHFLQEMGCVIIDLDQISRDLTQDHTGAALPIIKKSFGEAVFSAPNQLARGKLRHIIFQSPEAKKQLEEILHPLIHQEAIRQYETQTASIVVFDIPLLAESPTWLSFVDQVLLIDCDEEVQIARVQARSHLSSEEVRAILSNQAPRSARQKIATHTIDNSYLSLDELKSKLQALYTHWCVSLN